MGAFCLCKFTQYSAYVLHTIMCYCGCIAYTIYCVYLHKIFCSALFWYEKPCEEQIKCVSECLGPPSVLIESDDCEEKLKIESGKEAAWFDDDLDEYLTSLNYEELAFLDSKDSKCESEVKENSSIY